MSVQKNTPNFLKHSGLSFTTIVNQTMDLIKDDGALGIYCYLASKPANWEICQVHLSNRFGKGREYIQNRIKMLKEAGLIRIESIRDGTGKILHWETSLVNFIDNHITENPYCGDELPQTQNTGLTTSGKSQNLGKQALVIKDIKKIKDKNKNKREHASKRVPLSPDFEPTDKSKDLIRETAHRCNIEPKLLYKKFTNMCESTEKVSANWNAELENFLISERPSSKKSNESTFTEIRSTVPFFVRDETCKRAPPPQKFKDDLEKLRRKMMVN